MASHHAVAVEATSADSSLEIFCRSLALVGVAELFDKTWFMGLLLALRYRARTVFVGSFAALFLHTILAAAMGYAFARFLAPRVLNYMTAGLFFVFMGLYAKDWYFADPEGDAIEAGKEEAGGDVELLPADAEDTISTAASDEEGGAPQPSKGNAKTSGTPEHGELAVFGKAFMAVFIAEWGDRTQIAMVGQHASQPLVPVFLGSTVAFFLLTLSAVGAATLLHGQKLRERVVFGFSACCFGLFGLLALRDAIFSS
jgi:putative Ca2+/H+ antiporter (TMEM165/GDT1 family)